MASSDPAVALREAAAEWAGALKAPVRDSKDSAFKRLDNGLKRAAVRYADSAADTLGRMTKKRGYSREFTPRTERRIKIEVDRVPPTLNEAVRAKAKREGISLRALILGLLKDWLAK